MEKFLSAASRHWNNSDLLAQHGEYQEAAYLAGYVAECSLKALVIKGLADSNGKFKISKSKFVDAKVFSHDSMTLSGEALELALIISPLLRRYYIDPLASLSQWKPDHRYEEIGFLPDADFQAMINEAHEIAKIILIGFTLDGLLEDLPQ